MDFYSAFNIALLPQFRGPIGILTFAFALGSSQAASSSLLLFANNYTIWKHEGEERCPITLSVKINKIL